MIQTGDALRPLFAIQVKLYHIFLEGDKVAESNRANLLRLQVVSFTCFCALKLLQQLITLSLFINKQPTN